MDTMYCAAAEMLLFATQLGNVRYLGSAEQLQQEVLGALRDMVSRCRAAGIADAETAEARYAIVAFVDDRVLQSDWLGRAQWMSNPLQLQLYREYAAGENFFARMRALLNRGSPSQALEVYYLCLALGFAGAGGAQAARSYLEAARGRLIRTARAAPMSPHAVSTDPPRLTPRLPHLAWPLVLGSAMAALIGLCVLGWSLHGTLDRIAQEAAAQTAAQMAIAKALR